MKKKITLAIILISLLLVEGLTNITDEELRLFSENLLNLDHNIAQPVYHLQSKLGSRHRHSTNQTLSNLFEPLNANIILRETYAKFIKLLNNYNWKVEFPEEVTNEEQNEITDFLNTIIQTPVMNQVQEYLIQNDVINRNEDFSKLLYNLWFQLYPRKGNVLGSSGFEHVFVGEIKKKKITGLHNWIQIYLLEQQGHLNYQGYFSHIVFKKSVALLKLKFVWEGYTKYLSSMLISTSPEFEMGLYTVCFFLRPNAKCPIHLGSKTISIQTFKLKYAESEFVGSAYPTLSHSMRISNSTG